MFKYTCTPSVPVPLVVVVSGGGGEEIPVLNHRCNNWQEISSLHDNSFISSGWCGAYWHWSWCAIPCRRVWDTLPISWSCSHHLQSPLSCPPLTGVQWQRTRSSSCSHGSPFPLTQGEYNAVLIYVQLWQIYGQPSFHCRQRKRESGVVILQWQRRTWFQWAHRGVVSQWMMMIPFLVSSSGQGEVLLW